ncbi:MAG: TetR/AcrR family transcriptional regulator [Thermodesulfobacteriota bacterium]|jgi:AcrR family transcriptional regulator
MNKLSSSKMIKVQIKNPELIQKKQSQIVKGATKLFIKKGFSQTTMREISRASHLTIGNLYDYIGKKEDVFCLVFDSFHSVWVKRLEEEGISKIEDPKQKLEVVLEKMLNLANENRDKVLMVYSESKTLPKYFLKIIMEKESKLIEYIEQILKSGVEKGVFQIKDPFISANIIVYFLSMEALRGWNLRKRYTAEEVNKHIMEFIEASILR